MKRHISLFILLISFHLLSQIKSPSEFLGYEIGTEFSRHTDVVRYFEYVAANSNMVTYQSYGKTNERRPLTYAIVSSPKNLANIEQIRTDNLKQTGILNGNATPEIAIVWLSYNVHGNEASSTEASMVTLYKLITEKQAWLENTVVIIDPCINPDGRDRYANWYNQVKATPYNPSQIADEHNEPWPGGRPNHYLFDLNRDWAWCTQVESQQRLKIYNQWLPHVHVDFHEQGINEPYYFAPAAEPYHEIITPWQRDFQTQIGKNHAKYFDKEGWLFFTRQFFDLLYPSYGDTYPTYLGAIGMTYEQAGHGRAGLGIYTDEGSELTLVDRVAHHTTTGLSTVEIASQNAKKLNAEFKNFFNNSDLKYKSYILKGHPDKLNALAQLLDLHEIQYGFATSGTVNGLNYQGKKGSMDATGALVVSTHQPKGKMVKALLEQDAKLSEPLTYDITAWSLPYAYGLDCVASTSFVSANETNPTAKVINQVAPAVSLAGYIVEWNSLNDAQFLAELLQNDIKVRFSEKPLSINGNKFNRGSLIITKSDNRSTANFTETVTKVANKHGRTLFVANTSFSDNGTDFGSTDVKIINKNRIAMLKGKGVSSLSYGALWHFMEQQLKYPVTSIDTDDFNADVLSKFDILVLPSGWYQRLLNDSTLGELKSWIQKGGKVIAFDNALGAFVDKDGFDLKKNKTEDDKDETPKGNLTPYDQRERASVTNFITGSIYKVKLDTSHPMAFGYDDTYYSLKLGNDSYQFLENGYNVGYIEGDAVSVSGFSGDTAKAGLKNSLVFGETQIGSGSVVYLVDDVLFRSFWENGKLFFVNSLFMVNSNVWILD
ncbi:MAG: M14 family metallopeptidase [Flavobacteriaceae bacterium]|nr:zinc carboxypeptidase [Flavobacteriaceae bacterium]